MSSLSATPSTSKASSRLTFNSPSSAHSETSTIVYGHEAFESFRSRVLRLCRRLWPMALHEQTTVERLCGGSFNRILGLSIVQFRNVHSDKTEASHFILRVPRFLDAKVDADVSVLNLVSRYTGIEVPQCVYFDTSLNNPLEQPFMVQQRMAGVSLQEIYPSLCHEQQCAVARQVGHVFQSLLACKHDVAGAFISPSDTALSSHYPGVMASIQPFGMMADSLYTEQAEKEETLMRSFPYPRDPAGLGWAETLRTAFEHRRNICESQKLQDPLELRYLDLFLKATSAIDRLFSCHDNEICLCHLDLAPRNILVNIDASRPRLVGILDWDNAVFGPSFMACTPPMWLWAWDYDGDEDERTVNDLLPTQNQREIRKIFDDTAGPCYTQLAYLPEFRLARQLCYFAMHRFNSSTMVKEGDEFLTEIGDLGTDPASAVTPLPDSTSYKGPS